MPTAEAPSILASCGLELVPLLLVFGLFLWGRSLVRKHDTRGWRLAAWMPVVGLVVQHVGVLFTVLGLIEAFDAVSAAPPESRASQLASGIAHAMWATAIGLGAAVLIYLGCVVAFAIGTWRPAPQRAPEP